MECNFTSTLQGMKGWRQAKEMAYTDWSELTHVLDQLVM